MFKPKIKRMNEFVKFITFNTAKAITLAPFGIYIKDKYLKDEYIINHEKIHWKQEMEMFIIFFYIWYFMEWLWKTGIYGQRAYENLSHEREAFKYTYDLNYLKTRKIYSWIKYLSKSI
jgi:hypothetical protein